MYSITLEHYVWCIVCDHGLIAAEKLTRYKISSVVLRNVSQVVATITNPRIKPWQQRSVGLLICSMTV